MKYNMTTFVRGFLENTLGNKKTHGSYRVLEGDHCKVLVRGDTERGRPAGNSLIAIDLSTSTTRLVFMCGQPFRYKAARDINTSRYQSLMSQIISSNLANILSSGVVDESNSHALIEFGDTPYLFRYMSTNVDGEPWYTEGMCPKVFDVESVPNRVATIKEAIELVKIPDGQVVLLDLWTATPMHEEFQPPKLERVYEEILTTPLDPIKMGYSLYECVIKDNYIMPVEKPQPNTVMTSRQQTWQEATAKWAAATKSFTRMYPAEYKGIDVKKSRYSFGLDSERVGSIVITPSGNYVKGKMFVVGNREVKENLIVWHKLEKAITKYKL